MKPYFLAAIILVVSGPASADTAPVYRIVVDQKSEAARVVEVRLERRIGNADIGAIVDLIIEHEPRSYPRTTINFLLDTTRPGDGPWASATSVRDTQIRVPGLTADEERNYRADAAADRRPVIGSWLTSTPAAPGRLTVYRDNGRLMLDWQMRGSLSRMGELIETPTTTGTRFDHRDGSFETHFVMARDGVLEIHSKATLIAVGENIAGERGLVTTYAGADASRTGSRGTIVQPWPMPDREFITSSLRDSSEPVRDIQSAEFSQPAPQKPSSSKTLRRAPVSAGSMISSKGPAIDVGKVFFGQ